MEKASKKARKLVGATLIAGFVGGYLLSDTIDHTLEHMVHYRPDSIASVVQLGSPEYRLAGFRSEVRKDPESMKQYSDDFLELGFSAGLNQEAVDMVYGYAKKDLSANPAGRGQHLADIGAIAARNYPDRTYQNLPDEKKLGYARDTLFEYLKESGNKLRDNIGGLIYAIKTMAD